MSPKSSKGNFEKSSRNPSCQKSYKIDENSHFGQIQKRQDEKMEKIQKQMNMIIDNENANMVQFYRFKQDRQLKKKWNQNVKSGESFVKIPMYQNLLSKSVDKGSTFVLKPMPRKNSHQTYA